MKRKIFALTGALALLLSACGTGAGEPTTVTATLATVVEENAYRAIIPEEGKALLDGNVAFTLVDVRTAEEYQEAHIPGAINIANEAIGSTQPEQLPDLNKTVVVYCRSGRRSKEAADKLVALGYTDVRDLGGIINWPYETVSGAEPGTWEQSAPAGILSSFTTTDVAGNTVDASMLKDYKLNMINVWATYCGPCLQEMPELGELAEEYQDKGVQIIGLVTDVLNSDLSISESQVRLARDVAEKTQANYPHILPSQDLYGILSQITSVPTTFFVDENGQLVGYAYVGSRSKADWAAIVDETLAEVL